MKALKVTIGILNALWAVFLIYVLGNMMPEGGASLIACAAVFVSLGLTIYAINVDPDAPGGKYSLGMRFVRFLVWGIHILFLLLLLSGVFSRGSFGLLFLTIPSVLTLLLLYKTAKPKDAPAATTTDNSVESLTAFYQNYTMQHQAEMDAFARQFRTLLVERYGFREEFVQAESYTAEALPDVSAFAVWHHMGKTPEEAAKQIFNDMCFSPDVNNPAIFARHVDTGEDLPPDYDYKDWQHRYLGRTPMQKASFFIMTPVALALFYALVFLTYLPTDVWYYTSLGMSIALVMAFGISVYNRWKAGRLLTQPGKRKLKAYDLIWMPPFAVFMIWLTLAGGVGGVMTEMTGAPHTAVYIYKKSSGKPCLHVGDRALSLSKFCLRQEAHNSLPKDGQARFSGKQSWFGVTLSEIEPVF